MNIARQIKPRCLNSCGFFTWFGLHGLDLPLQFTSLCCLHMECGYEGLQIARNSKFLKCDNHYISEFGLILFTGLCLGAIYSSQGRQSLNFVCHIQGRKGSICHYVFETSKFHLYGLIRNMGSSLMLANQTKKCF